MYDLFVPVLATFDVDPLTLKIYASVVDAALVVDVHSVDPVVVIVKLNGA